MTKSIPVTSRELGEIYQALLSRVEFYETTFDLNDVSFRRQYSAIYSSYLDTKSACKIVESLYFN